MQNVSEDAQALVKLTCGRMIDSKPVSNSHEYSVSPLCEILAREEVIHLRS